MNIGVLEQAGAALVHVTNQTPNVSILRFMAGEEIGWNFLFLLPCALSPAVTMKPLAIITLNQTYLYTGINIANPRSTMCTELGFGKTLMLWGTWSWECWCPVIW